MRRKEKGPAQQTRLLYIATHAPKILSFEMRPLIRHTLGTS